MISFQHILVPVDFSPCSDHAVETAVALALKLDARITLMHAYAVPVYPLPEGFVVAPADTTRELIASSQKGIDAQLARAQALGATKLETLLVEGAAVSEIHRVAAERGVDLIVMGTHGRSGLKHVLLGSVAEKVIRKAHCAVMTVREPQAAPAGSHA